MSGQSQAEFVERTVCINCSSRQLNEIARGRFSDQPLAGFLEADPWGESPMPYLQSSEWILVSCFHRRQYSTSEYWTHNGTSGGFPNG
jgi:hypothetical protein